MGFQVIFLKTLCKIQEIQLYGPSLRAGSAGRGDVVLGGRFDSIFAIPGLSFPLPSNTLQSFIFLNLSDFFLGMSMAKDNITRN